MSNPLDYLYEAVGWVFTHIYDVLKPLFGASSGWTWALSIVILVVLMRLIMVPLFIKQMHTTRAMSSLQPQMAALRKKYKNDRQTLNQETMKLYQEAGVNPLMGCLPVVAQLPLFFGLFSVLRAIAEYTGGAPKYGLPLSMVLAGTHAKILGASIADKVLFTDGVNVPLHAKLVIVLAVMVSMVTTFLTIRQSQKRGMMPAATPDNPMASSQKYMTYIMPFFALTGLYWPFGLVLYWVTTNVWTLGQQWLLGRRFPYTPPATATDGGAVPSAAAARSLTSGGSKSASTRTQQAKTTGTRTQQGKATATRAQQAGSQPGGNRTTGTAANGASANGSGQGGGATAASMLKRLGRRSEPEPEPELPDVKLVRHQTQRQSRSKRSGKR
ncbi:MAG TPA: membrane protein insertase YidC [Streptosporangiaceae bacterium]|nr:membrane protein insertase YidC [Streptosporangiaceae bacterium]